MEVTQEFDPAFGAAHGSDYFGKVDVVPGIGRVETLCDHVNFVPLVPRACAFRLEDAFCADLGLPVGTVVEVPYTVKALAAVFARSVIAVCLFLVLFALGLEEGPLEPFATHTLPEKIFTGAICVGSLFVAIQVWVLCARRASWARARALVSAAGLGPAGAALVDVAYGRIEATPAELRARTTPEQLPAQVVLAGVLLQGSGDSIRFGCPRCEATMRVELHLMGRQGRCTRCRAPLRVPTLRDRFARIRGSAEPFSALRSTKTG